MDLLQQALGAGGTRVPDVLHFLAPPGVFTRLDLPHGTVRNIYRAGAGNAADSYVRTGTGDPEALRISWAARPYAGNGGLSRTFEIDLQSALRPVVRGTLPAVDRVLSIAVVGSRKASRAGLQAAFRISQGLARAGVIVISGGARGVDHTAHEAALSAGGTTVSVLPCGIDYPYLMEYRSFRDQIAERGALLSEYPPGTQLQNGRFACETGSFQV